jgi:hypothetical protein
LAQSDRHNPPGLVDELVPGIAAGVDQIVIGFEDTVREPVVAHELPDVLDRMSSGDFDGKGRMVMLAGTTNLADRCYPA